MLAACNHGWTMYPGLLHGACECLHRHGSAALRERYLAKIVSGEWLATMALTEAHWIDVAQHSADAAEAARALASGSVEPDFCGTKRETTAHWMRHMLPRLQAHLAVIGFSRP